MFHYSKLILAFACLALALVSADVARREQISSRAHFFKRVAVIRNAPYAVQLRNESANIMCAGTIISPQHILTAAHCLDECMPADLTVVAGASSNSENGIQRKISQFFVHDSYNPSTYHNDVAVLKLDSALEFSESVEALKICSGPILENDEFFAVAGWHHTKPEQLRVTTKVPVMLQEECMDDAKTQGIDVLITDSMICNDPRDRSACDIIPGGGAVCAMREVCGIVVGGSACDNPKFPGIYTNVFNVRDFIENSLKA
ncbi:trypsin beta-like [Haematobia irritans]|uniref:trypsin beta-like n=1 Tax=Haematobia irritans TaxID=7368 RepID=UPI003F4F871E